MRLFVTKAVANFKINKASYRIEDFVDGNNVGFCAATVFMGKT